ncbi:MAG: ribose 5-phosphate isomerase A [Gammaproteobacteria bacterium]|jgi:ribose 5-phosphate isomerase A|nr:ribose 5-phosphate isomerase A [Gammaproteobacteria bacterium]RZO90588.1 MAG: ribose-5-phosphate isomerase RpiA [Gammaproteobacteria bacterium]
MSSDQENLKRQSAAKALDIILPKLYEDSIIGIGTGSTVDLFIEMLAEKNPVFKAAVSSSERSSKLLEQKGIEVSLLNDVGGPDIYVDGADEYDDKKQLIKGGGGALTREKIIAYSAREFICIVDESKKVNRLGSFPLAIEVLEYARSFVAREIVKLGGKPTYRTGFVTDQGNQILDVLNLDYAVPYELEIRLNRIPGVVENGIFAQKTATKIVVATQNGVEVID